MGLINRQIITDCLQVILPVILTTIISKILLKKCINSNLMYYNRAYTISENKNDPILLEIKMMAYNLVSMYFKTYEMLASACYAFTLNLLKVSYVYHNTIINELKWKFDPLIILTVIFTISVTLLCVILINIINIKDNLSKKDLDYFKRRYIFDILYGVILIYIIR